MNFYKNKDDDFFVQLNNRESHQSEISIIDLKQHDGSEDKHQPIIIKENNIITVKIGEIMHPMNQEHHISMIFLKTNQGGQYKLLSGLETPIVHFALSEDEKPIEVYSYCNIHGLWKTEA